MRVFKISLFILALTLSAHGLLQAYMPSCAVQAINQPINYTLANFGHILYGRTIIGELIITQNSQFCDLDQITQDFSTTNQDDIKRFFLIKRGTCKFTKKILNAQKKGADMVIIYDNQFSTTANIIMSNDGFGHLVNIPSILVSSIDGQKLIKTYNDCQKKLVLKIYFDVYTSKIVNVTFWLDVSNRQSFITIKDFYNEYFNVISKYINIDLKYKVNQNCGVQMCQSNDCMKNQAQFCMPVGKIIQDVAVQGKQYILEQTRQYYLFQSLKLANKVQNWFKYMIQFDQSLCMQKLDLKQCSIDIIKKYDDPAIIEQKVAENLNQMNLNKPNLYQKWVNDGYKSDILFYPQASINGRNFYGLFRAPDIFEMICQSLEKQPKECYSFNRDRRNEQQGINNASQLWKTILFIITFMVLLFFAILFIYNRLIRRQMNQQMSMEVNKMVEHYVAMTQQKSRTNASIEMK